MFKLKKQGNLNEISRAGPPLRHYSQEDTSLLKDNNVNGNGLNLSEAAHPEDVLIGEVVPLCVDML
jgi:hypothetical protein